MGFITRLVDRIDAKLDRPADQELLRTDRDRGGSATDASDSSETGSAEGAGRDHTRRRPRWLTFGR